MKIIFLIETHDHGTIEIEGETFGTHLNENCIIEAELVFTTGMSGILETITDPSFSDQILIMSFPPFGNYGAPDNRLDSWGLSMEFESKIVSPLAIICDHQVNSYSHWNAEMSIDKFLYDNKVYGIKNVDTRMLIKYARQGLGVVKLRTKYTIPYNETYLIGGNKKSFFNNIRNKQIPSFYQPPTSRKLLFIDCGAKTSQIRNLLDNDFIVHVVAPRWNNMPDPNKVQSLGYSGIFMSNGPYDPQDWGETLKWVQQFIACERNKDKKLPIFGICLGHQLLALACGLKTRKMKIGNRAQNVPVKCMDTPYGFITSQNHGYEVDQSTISSSVEWIELFHNLNDGSNEGIIHKKLPYFSVQFHPEARPGPLDTTFLFEMFREIIESGRQEIISLFRERFPKLESTKKESGNVLVIGSGGLSIGQAGEFDYSGSQALKSFKKMGCKTVLLNPNIATIQTDVADVCYINPIEPEVVEKIIQEQNIKYISVSFGGQTALNCGIICKNNGIFDKYGVEVLGTTIENITKSEDRKLFKEEVESIGLQTPPSETILTLEDAERVSETLGFPLLVRAGFCLGGQGSGFAKNKEELKMLVTKALSISTTVILDKSLLGWKELEYEILRDKVGNKICVCTMENMDPLGVHTGESIVVAPVQTLNDREHQMLRNACFKIVDQFKIVGECNVQFALDPKSETFVVIEMNARLSRSSALASKATGYPIASVAAKLNMEWLLPDIKNDITKNTTAFYEPSLDYMAVKVPRWDLLKFPGVSITIGSHMKSVGEVMALGRTFPEAIMKASRMVGNFNGTLGLFPRRLIYSDEISKELQSLQPNTNRLLDILDYFWEKRSIQDINKETGIDAWFLSQLKFIAEAYYVLSNQTEEIEKNELRRLKSIGFSDLQLAKTMRKDERDIVELRKSYDIHPVFHKIDTVAAEFPCDTNYLYMTYRSKDNEYVPDENTILVLGSGVYRIGSSVEFDWCSVKCVEKLREMGKKVMFLNHNPETVSTDYDMVDALIFEEITPEVIYEINHICKSKLSGIILSVGGQVANNIALDLDDSDIPILGTSPEMIDRAEDRSKFSALLDEIGVDQPEWSSFTTLEESLKFCNKVKFPVLVRPSYVLSGAGMKVVYTRDEMLSYLDNSEISSEYPVVITKFIEYAKEIEVDGVAHWGSILAMGISEHIENAGVHSGDATLIFPAIDLTDITRDRIELIVRRITQALSITGPFNIQLIAKDDELKVIECNVRVSRSFPLVSKTSGTNLIHLATEILTKQYERELWDKHSGNLHLQCNRIGVKVPQFSHHRLDGADVMLGVEMTSTGEVAGFGNDQYEAFIKAFFGTGGIPRFNKKHVLITTYKQKYLDDIMSCIEEAEQNGWSFTFTHLHPETYIIVEKDSDIVKDEIKNEIYDFVINIPHYEEGCEGFLWRRACLDFKVPVITNIKKAKMLLTALCRTNGPYDINTGTDIL